MARMVGKQEGPQPVVAEMEEAMQPVGCPQSMNRSRGSIPEKSDHSSRLSVFEDLRDGLTPIELDFSLQDSISLSHLSSKRAATVPAGVTAIAPAPAGRRRTRLAKPSRRAIRTATAKAAVPGAAASAKKGGLLAARPAIAVLGAARSLQCVVFRDVVPAVRNTGRRLGRRVAVGAGGAVRLLGGAAAGGGHLVAGAGKVAAGAVAQSSIAVARTAHAAAGAVRTGVAVAAAQPVRLARLARQAVIHIAEVRRIFRLRKSAATAGKAGGGGAIRRVGSKRHTAPADSPGQAAAGPTTPATATAAATAADPKFPAPVSASARQASGPDAASQAAAGPTPPGSAPSFSVLRARPLIVGMVAMPDAARRGPLTMLPPYVAATAVPVPALLLPGDKGTATAIAAAAANGDGGSGGGGAGGSTRTSGGAAGSAKTPRRKLPPAAPAAVAAAARPVWHRLGAVLGLLRVPLRLAFLTAKITTVTATYGATALLCAFFPKSCHAVGLAALLSGPSLPLPLLRLPGRTAAALRNPLYGIPLLRLALAPLAPLRGPFAAFATMRVVGPLLAPSVWRNAMYWQRAVPIVTRYLVTGRRAAAMQSRGDYEGSEQLWQRQHEWGAGAIFDMLADLKGFYLKLGQILASKTDMLPQPYTESLSRLLDRLPPAPYRAVRHTIQAELGAPAERLFRDLDPFPLASATIAQVHRGTLPDGRPVVVKVQHGAARGMMRSDLANLAALSGLVEGLGLQLGFDHRSLVREYNVQVPLEFDFAREARVASAIRTSLERASASFPTLRRVVVPRMVPSHTAGRVLTMEYLDGVPLLDIAGMDLVVRHELMTALILAYGVMILRDGLFHSDPHPGNVLAMRRRREPGSSTNSNNNNTSRVALPSNGIGRYSSTASAASGGTTGLSEGGDAAWMASLANGQNPHQYQNPLFQPSQGGAPPGAGEAALLESNELQVALIDFGQSKKLSDASRARYAMLVAAMAVRDDELVLAVSSELGLVVDNCSPQFAAVASYILFDTRMDFPEAHMGPMHPEAHEFRTAKVPSLPQDLFMIMRSITLLRGLLSSLAVDVSSAQLWRPLALQVLADLTPIYRGPMLSSGPDVDGVAYITDPASQMAEDLAAVVPLDFVSNGGAAAAAAITSGALLSPAAAAAVMAAATRPEPSGPSGVISRVLGAISGGGSSGGSSPRSYDKAAAEAARKAERAEREAAEAERKRLAREAAAAARREEEARRRAEWEDGVRKKREEQEAKAERVRAQRAEVEARKVAERAEREARKRAEIEASNDRRKAEREAAESQRKAERERQLRSRGGTPSRVAAAPPTPASPASPPSPTLPTPPTSARSASGEEAGRVIGNGVIHSPMPVRFAPVPYSALSAQPSPRTGPTATVGGSGRYGSAVGAKPGVNGDGVGLHDAVQKTTATAPPPVSLASVVRAGSPLTAAVGTTAGRTAEYPAAQAQAPGVVTKALGGGGRFAPHTPPRAVPDGPLGGAAPSAVAVAEAAEVADTATTGKRPAALLAPATGGDVPNGVTTHGSSPFIGAQQQSLAALAATSPSAASPGGASLRKSASRMAAPSTATTITSSGSAAITTSTAAMSRQQQHATMTTSNQSQQMSQQAAAVAAVVAAPLAPTSAAAADSDAQQRIRLQLQHMEQLQMQLRALQAQQRQQARGGGAAATEAAGTAAPAAAATGVDLIAQAQAYLDNIRKQTPSVPPPTSALAVLGASSVPAGAVPPPIGIPIPITNASAAPNAHLNTSTSVGIAPSSSAGSGDSLVSKRRDRERNSTNAPSTMFLPSGMRPLAAVSSSATGHSVAANRAGSTEVRGLGGTTAASISAASAAPVTASTGAGVVVLASTSNGRGGIAATAAGNGEIEPVAATGTATASPNGAVVSTVPQPIPLAQQPPMSPPASQSSIPMQLVSVSMITAAAEQAAAAAGSREGSGDAGAVIARTTAGGMVEGTRASGGGSGLRTGDGVALQTDEDYSMWLARQQPLPPQVSLPGSEPSASISLASMGSPQGPLGLPGAQGPGTPQSLLLPAQGPFSLVSAQDIVAAHDGQQQQGQQPLSGVAGAAVPGVLLSVAGPRAVGSGGGAASAGGAISSGGGSASMSGGGSAAGSGWKSSGGGGKSSASLSPASSGRKESGMESVKKGLSRIGRKIIGGLAAP